MRRAASWSSFRALFPRSAVALALAVLASVAGSTAHAAPRVAVGAVAAAISCPAGFADADGFAANGCETNLMTDLRNCGALGVVVPAGGSCVAGTPQPAANTGATSAKGAPAVAPAAAAPTAKAPAAPSDKPAAQDSPSAVTPAQASAAVSGRPLSCPAGFADADGYALNGCETNLMTDLRNCGAVGVVVPSGGTCAGGVPQAPRGSRCPAGTADADGNPANGCEVNLLTDLANCGRLGNAVQSGGACVNGSAVAQPPARFDFTLLGMPGQGVQIGQSQGPSTCTGTSASRTCTQVIGTKTSFRDSAPMRDEATGRQGTMTVECSVMYSGTSVAYVGRPGRADATGSQDCTLEFVLGGGDTVRGSMHQQRTLVANRETSTFSIVLTGGSGRYALFQATIQSSSSEQWPAPEPLPADLGKDGGAQPADGGAARTTQSAHSSLRQAVALIRTAGGQPSGDGSHGSGSQRQGGGGSGGGGGGGKFALRRSARQLADFATVGLLVPSNKPTLVKVVASPGATCSGILAGSVAVPLPPVRADERGIATFSPVPAGTLRGSAPVKARVACYPRGSRTPAVAQAKLTPYTVRGR